jgi:hypothetical protein
MLLKQYFILNKRWKLKKNTYFCRRDNIYRIPLPHLIHVHDNTLQKKILKIKTTKNI